jgi:hypothetical protein
MARADQEESTSKQTRTSRRGAKAATEALPTCPECGRTFGRPAALGAHRRQAHGVVGASAGARASSQRRQGRKAAATRSGTAAAAGTPTARAAGTTIDRNGLLRALFPNGIPADVNTIRSVNKWLDDAEHWLDEAVRIAGNA